MPVNAPAAALLLHRDRDVLRRSQSAALSRARQGGRGAGADRYAHAISSQDICPGGSEIAVTEEQVIVSSGKIDLAEALAWAAENRTFLEEKWAEYSGDGQ
jgi:hypothetical protein